MKVNKPKSPFISGTDAPDEKDIAKAIKGEKFAETLSALESASAATAAPSATRSALTAIASQYDLSDENGREEALFDSAEVLVKSRLGEKHQKAEKAIGELRDFVANDPFLRGKLLSVLQKLSDARN